MGGLRLPARPAHGLGYKKGKDASQMKAVVIHKFGEFDVLKYEDIERPSPRSGHVLIKVLAAGVERLDHYIREGSIVPELPFPHILGADAVGEVAELGEGVTSFEIGERVIVAPGYSQKEEEANIRPTVTAPSFALPGLHISGTYTQFMEQLILHGYSDLNARRQPRAL